MPFRRGHLDYFVAVAEDGQITRAAARLHVAQPALSQAMAQLENEVGVTLLQRHARGVTLTPAGEAFLLKARAAVAADAEAALTAEWLARAAQGTIEFGFVGHAPAIDSPGLLDAFRSAHPDVNLRFHELPFPSPQTKLWLAEVDLAVCHRPPSDSDTWMHPLREEPRVVLTSRTHDLVGRDAVSVEEIIGETFVGTHPSVDREWSGFWTLDDYRGSPAERTGDQAKNAQEMIAALAATRSITTAPESVAAMMLTDLSGISAIPLVDASPAVICLSGHADRNNPLVAEVLAFARGLKMVPGVHAQA
jgi:DNA-binding transcriptional LysR family regulator